MEQLTKVVDAETDWPEASIIVEVGRQRLHRRAAATAVRADAVPEQTTRWSGGPLNSYLYLPNLRRR